MMGKLVRGFAVISVISVTGIILTHSPKTQAQYNGANLLSNPVFLDAKSMSKSSIQSFLESKGSGIKDKSFLLNCYGSDSKEREWYTAVGAPCDQTIPASHIIYYAAQIYGISPKVILSTLQKEQSLVTSPNPTSWQINQAMGYGCPDSGQCSGSSNFFYQIDSGTWALRYHFERARGNLNWWTPSDSWVCGSEKNYYKPNLYPNNQVRFYDDNNVHYRTHLLANAATSALYCYTPHAYNNPQGLYGLPKFGTAGMYYSGSYNFVKWFETWFGSTQYLKCAYPTDTKGGVYRLMQPNRNAYFLTTNPSEVCTATASLGYIYDGIAFYPSESVDKLPVYRMVRDGIYFYTISTSEINGAKSLGFKLEGVAFFASPTLNAEDNIPVYRLQYNLTGGYFYTPSIAEANEAISKLGYRMEGVAFYMNNDDGKTYPHNVYRLSHPNSGYLMTVSSAERQSAVSSYSYTYEGVGFYTRVGFTTDNLPVYRMAGKRGYVLTTSLSERKLAYRLGYRSEGITFYAYPTSNLGASKSVFRLSHANGNYLYTISTTERDRAVKDYNYRFEGEAFRVP